MLKEDSSMLKGSFIDTSGLCVQIFKKHWFEIALERFNMPKLFLEAQNIYHN